MDAVLTYPPKRDCGGPKVVFGARKVDEVTTANIIIISFLIIILQREWREWWTKSANLH